MVGNQRFHLNRFN